MDPELLQYLPNLALSVFIMFLYLYSHQTGPTGDMLKQIGQLIGLLIGSTFSPTWVMLTYVTKNYIDLNVIKQGPAAMLAEVAHYQLVVQADPTPVLTQMIPNMIAVLMIGGLFVWSFGWVGGKLLPMAWDKIQQMMNPTTTPVVD